MKNIIYNLLEQINVSTILTYDDHNINGMIYINIYLESNIIIIPKINAIINVIKLSNNPFLNLNDVINGYNKQKIIVSSIAKHDKLYLFFNLYIK